MRTIIGRLKDRCIRAWAWLTRPIGARRAGDTKARSFRGAGLKISTPELCIRLEAVAAQKGADCPHLLMEAAKRLSDINRELRGIKRTLSRHERRLKNGVISYNPANKTEGE